MVFSSLLFLFLFLPLFFIAYYITPTRFRNAIALLGSVFFYTWGAPKFIFVLLFGCAIDYALSIRIDASGDQRKKRTWLAISIIVNIGLLAYCKYANFFVGEINQTLSYLGLTALSWTPVLLPIGISFFTFHKISYIVDVYRGVPPARSLFKFLLYILLFPQLIAGPIVRYHQIEEQIDRRTYVVKNIYDGLLRFVLGLGKKVLIANPLGAVADSTFGFSGNLPPELAWLGIVCYAFQIYFDFSGYSDMAIGLAKMMGFHFPENFNYPYVARSITDFWRRWHISLSSFMREYVYIPMGGNKVGPLRRYFNLWFVFVLSGFWHGANWTFFLWGVYYGTLLILEKAFLLRLYNRLPRLLTIPVTFVLVLLGWVLFRADTITAAWAYLGRMFDVAAFGQGSYQIVLADLMNLRTMVVFGIAVALAFIPWRELGKRVDTRMTHAFARVVIFSGKTVFLFAVYALSILSLATAQFNPFIYFRF